MSALPLRVDDAMKSWSNRGFNCEYHVDPPGSAHPQNICDTDEVIVVLEGEVEVELAGKMVHPREGEELVIPATVEHKVRNIGSSTLHWLYGSEQEQAQTD